jgi:hypothetical protein
VAAENDVVEIALLGRAHSTITTGISSDPARPMPSVISESPGPLVAVIARTPVNAAPITMLIAASSSSACTVTPPKSGACFAIHSSTSVAGVIG